MSFFDSHQAPLRYDPAGNPKEFGRAKIVARMKGGRPSASALALGATSDKTADTCAGDIGVHGHVPALCAETCLGAQSADVSAHPQNSVNRVPNVLVAAAT